MSRRTQNARFLQLYAFRDDNDDALRQASRNGHLEIVKYLIENGANIHAENDYALRWASNEGHLEVVKYLIKKGTDVHAENDHALRWASGKGHLEIVKFLIENHETINMNLCNDLHKILYRLK